MLWFLTISLIIIVAYTLHRITSLRSDFSEQIINIKREQEYTYFLIDNIQDRCRKIDQECKVIENKLYFLHLVMIIDSETKIDEIGYLLRANGFSLNIEYGAGGYEVCIKDSKSNSTFTEYSHDLLEAIKLALDKASVTKKFKAKLEREDVTIPATPKTKLSISDLSKLLSSGEKDKIKF